MSAVPASLTPQHDRKSVEAVWAKAHVGPTSLTSITPVLVADPFANKVGLGDPDEIRLMWAIDGTGVTKHHDRFGPGGGPAPVYPDGTVLQVVTLIDDATLKLGGNFTCDVTTP